METSRRCDEKLMKYLHKNEEQTRRGKRESSAIERKGKLEPHDNKKSFFLTRMKGKIFYAQLISYKNPRKANRTRLFLFSFFFGLHERVENDYVPLEC